MTRDEEIAELRRRLAELESEPRDAPEPVAPPVARVAAPPTGVRRLWLILGAAVIVLLVIVGVTGNPSTTPAASSNVVAPDKVVPLAPIEPVSPWVYSDLDDPMATTKGVIACTTSKNEVMLDFPYKPVTADLCIRKMPRGGLNIFVRLNGDGQILCTSYEGCSVLVRHDEMAPHGVHAVGPADNSSNAIFFNGETKLLGRIQSSKITRVELNLYQAGQQTVEFNTADLQWPPSPAKNSPGTDEQASH